jgi:hypothetical protein
MNLLTSLVRNVWCIGIDVGLPIWIPYQHHVMILLINLQNLFEIILLRTLGIIITFMWCFYKEFYFFYFITHYASIFQLIDLFVT